jgi:hypothetical protein
LIDSTRDGLAAYSRAADLAPDDDRDANCCSVWSACAPASSMRPKPRFAAW